MDRSVSSGAVTERRPLRIVVFHLGFFYSGGGERLVLEQVRWLRERGHSVEVFAPIVDPVKCFPELIAEVHPRELLRRAPDLFGVGDGLTLIASAVRARGLTKGLVADVYLRANQPGAWLARAAARQHGRRYVVYFSQPNRLLLPRAIDRDASSQVVRRDFHLLSAAANLRTPRPAPRHPCIRRRHARAHAHAATRRCAQPGCPRGRRSTLLTTRTNGHPWARAF